MLIDRKLSPIDLDMLRAFHDRFAAARPAWQDRIEVQYVPAAAMASFKETAMAIAVISPGEPFHPTTVGPDWLQNWYDVRENGSVLRGPAASTLIPPISKGEFVAAIRGYVTELRDRVESVTGRRGSLAYIVLSLCRARHTCATGEQISKRDAAALARIDLPQHAGIIDWAMAIRTGDRDLQYQLPSPSERGRAIAFVRDVAPGVISTRPFATEAT